MDTPRPSPCTNRTRRVPHPVLIGHAASLSQAAALREELASASARLKEATARADAAAAARDAAVAANRTASAALAEACIARDTLAARLEEVGTLFSGTAGRAAPISTG